VRKFHGKKLSFLLFFVLFKFIPYQSQYKEPKKIFSISLMITIVYQKNSFHEFSWKIKIKVFKEFRLSSLIRLIFFAFLTLVLSLLWKDTRGINIIQMRFGILESEAGRQAG
jgi:hypothetical protein